MYPIDNTHILENVCWFDASNQPVRIAVRQYTYC
jgi:hypothetical protein